MNWISSDQLYHDSQMARGCSLSTLSLSLSLSWPQGRNERSSELRPSENGYLIISHTALKLICRHGSILVTTVLRNGQTFTQERGLEGVLIHNISWGSTTPDLFRSLRKGTHCFGNRSPFILDLRLICLVFNFAWF